MIDMHENFSIHHHYSSKTVRSTPISPRSVDSSESLCSNERTEDNMSDNSTTHTVEPFVKVRSRSSEHISPGDLASYEMNNSLQRSFSLDNAQRKRSVSPFQAASPNKSFSEQPQVSPSKAFVVSSGYETMNENCPKNMVARVVDMGLPTMIPTNALITPTISPPMEIQQQFRLQNSSFSEKKKAEVVPSRSPNSFNTTARGIIGSCRGNTRAAGSPSPEDRAQYKRPPHTYPALIASAILDSPGHLITLRGIYDYIMNHFPYYKYCHDKSAWQNSIRHNLSLNQCFVKVPRYENAAKSNYWTMTREGFEEFGNENSFKRRRRRGAALAPISAYKAKKYQSEAKNNKSKTDTRTHSTTNNSSVGTNGSDEKYPIPFPSQLMGLAGSWVPGLRAEGDSVKSRKRSQSPVGKEGSKHPRMLVLKQGEGPSLGGINVEDQKRPKSLSSVEEMHGTLNSFNKSLLDSSVLTNTPPHILTANSQSWITEAQKTLMASSGIFLPPLIPTDRRSSSPEKSGQTNPTSDERCNGNGTAIVKEGVQIGSELTLRYDNSDVPTRHFRCHFCPYTYVSTTGDHLEQHVWMFHQLDVTTAKAKAVAVAAVAKTQNERSSKENPKETQERLLSLQNMVSNLSSRSLMAARQSSAQSLLAAAQASVSNGATGYPYSGNLSSGVLDESAMRSIAEQVTASQANAVKNDREKGISHNAETYAFHRQQAINNAIQQAAGVSSTSTSSQEQLRLFYQQLAIPNPFLGNSTNPLTAAFPRPMPTGPNQQLWQYQQKLYNHMKALSDETSRDDSTSHSRHNSLSDEVIVSGQNSSSSCKSSSSSVDVETYSKKSIHGWKQCVQCDFTAKGDHGLDLHYRKVHSQASTDMTPKDESARQSPPNLDITGKESSSPHDVSQSNACIKANCEEQCDSPLTSLAYPTPPLSNSPSYTKSTFAPLDLSGVKEEELRKSSATAVTTASTQTAPAATEVTNESRTCRHCDIVFGDEMMHALHMSCHDKNDPFKCTICGQMCNEKYYFNVHLLRGLHQTDENNNTTSVSKPDLLPEDALSHDNASNASRRQSNSSDASSVTCRGRLNSDNSEVVSCQ